MIVVVYFLTALSFCRPSSEEARLHRFFDALVERAERSDLEAIMARLAPDYLDFEGRDKETTQKFIAGYLERRKGIVIHLLTTRIEGRDPTGRTLVRTEIILSSGAAEALRRLVTVAGECYRFEFGLTEDPGGGWHIRSASWSHLETEELLPESLEVVKKLFSGK